VKTVLQAGGLDRRNGEMIVLRSAKRVLLEYVAEEEPDRVVDPARWSTRMPRRSVEEIFYPYQISRDGIFMATALWRGGRVDEGKNRVWTAHLPTVGTSRTSTASIHHSRLVASVGPLPNEHSHWANLRPSKAI
jgi:hypothetical protein